MMVSILNIFNKIFRFSHFIYKILTCAFFIFRRMYHDFINILTHNIKLFNKKTRQSVLFFILQVISKYIMNNANICTK